MGVGDAAAHGNNTLISKELSGWAKRSIERIRRQTAQVKDSRRPRKLVVVHLDGVPRSVLDDAVAQGWMPFFSRMVRSGAYSLESAFWGSPASTPAFQAGLLYGLRHPNLPAYWWFDRELGRRVQMNHPPDTLQMQKRLRLASREQLFGDGGTAYLSLFDGASSNQLCMAGLADRKSALGELRQNFKGMRGPRRQNPLQFAYQVARDTACACRDALGWGGRLRDMRHEKEYVLNRFFLISMGWELAQSRVLIDMVRGVPSIYLVFGNFDEVAHRRGPFSAQARNELIRADRAFEELYVMGRSLEQPYDVVFVTDHGHVDSEPFERASGTRLERYLIDGPPLALPAEVREGLLDGRDPLALGRVHPRDEAVVVESGNFSHVYLTHRKTPLEARELLALFPDVVARAARSPHIGITAVRRGDGAVALIGGKVYRPDEIARAPLHSEWSRRAVADLLAELPHMPTAGDLVLFGEVVSDSGTVGFAWEFGSHGGLTRTETDSVVCWPKDSRVDLSGLEHSTELHRRLMEAYRH